MIPHLHLHLEPMARKRAELRAGPDDTDFFEARLLSRTGRPRVLADDLRRYLLDLHKEQRAEGIGYAEVRLAPQRFLLDGMTWPELLSLVQTTVSGLADPVLRVILLVVRESTPEALAEFGDIVAQGLPSVFVGIDLAGDERRPNDPARMKPLFHASGKLGRTVHAGEFGGVDSIWHAVDQLGAERIGHGLAAADDPALMRHLARNKIMCEVSITSNMALGAVADATIHPVVRLAEFGVPVCFNTDVPFETGSRLADELDLAVGVLAIARDELLAWQRLALAYAFSSVPPQA